MIRKLAEFDLFVFSWRELSRLAVKHGFFNVYDQMIFLNARLIKNYYRSGYICQVSSYFLERLLESLNKIVKTSIRIRFAPKRETFHLDEKFKDGSYKQLRAIEILCAYYGFKSAPRDLLKLIKDPNLFALAKGKSTLHMDCIY